MTENHHSKAVLFFCGVIAGIAVATAFVYWDVAFNALGIFHSLMPNVICGFAIGFSVPLLLAAISAVRGKLGVMLILCTLSGITASALVYWQVGFSDFDVFDTRKINTATAFLAGFTLPLLLFLRKLVSRIYIAFANRKQQRRAAVSHNIQQVIDYEQEARDILRQLGGNNSPSPHKNQETELKRLRTTREKIRLEPTDDPADVGEAVERLDDRIRDLELQIARHPEAIDLPTLDAAISRHPNNAVLHIERGYYYLNTESDSYKALAEFKRSLALLPHYAPAHYALGMAYLDRKKYRKAARHFHNALRVDPDFSAAHEGLAEIRKKKRHW